MPSTTASDPEADALLLDSIEKYVGDRDVSVTFKRCWMNAHRPESWQVTYHLEASKSPSKPDGKAIAMASGGGRTLREALQNAFVMLVSERLAR